MNNAATENSGCRQAINAPPPHQSVGKNPCTRRGWLHECGSDVFAYSAYFTVHYAFLRAFRLSHLSPLQSACSYLSYPLVLLQVLAAIKTEGVLDSERKKALLPGWAPVAVSMNWRCPYHKSPTIWVLHQGPPDLLKLACRSLTDWAVVKIMVCLRPKWHCTFCGDSRRETC